MPNWIEDIDEPPVTEAAKSGGIGAIALALAVGKSAAPALGAIERRVGPISHVGRQALLDFARQTVAAGARLTEHGHLGEAGAPINPELFGGDAEGVAGRRYRAIGDFEIMTPGGPIRRRMVLDFSSQPELADILQAAQEAAVMHQRQSPRRFAGGDYGASDIEVTGVAAMSIQAKF
jgi:hypothetical protein